MILVVPVALVFLLVYAFLKKVNVYNSFVCGAKKSFDLTLSFFPYLAATFLMVNALRQSGLWRCITDFLAPPFALLGVPKQVVQLVLLRPFSGSGSLAVLSQIYADYGVDSYVGRCASVIMGSSETVFYLAAIYFSETHVKRTGFAIPIALFCNLIGSILACLFCKIW